MTNPDYRLLRSSRHAYPISPGCYWQQVKFGKYFGLTLPMLFFANPDYIYWGLEKGAFKGSLNHQAGIIAARAAHIKPPRPRPEFWEFEIAVGGWSMLKSISVTRKSKRTASDTGRCVWLDHLDVSIIRLGGERRGDASDLILTFLRDEWFDGHDPTTRGRCCELFFENDDNFDLTCRGRHRLNKCE